MQPAFLLDCQRPDVRELLSSDGGLNFHFFSEKALMAPLVVREILGAQHHGNTWILAQHERF